MLESLHEDAGWTPKSKDIWDFNLRIYVVL